MDQKIVETITHGTGHRQCGRKQERSEETLRIAEEGATQV